MTLVRKQGDGEIRVSIGCFHQLYDLCRCERPVYAPDIQFLPIIHENNGIHEMLKKRNINYIGSELLFTNMDSELATEEYRDKMHRDGKLCWVNTIVYNYKAVLSAFHSDDTALAGNPEFGWGWCADNFDIIQTDWVGAISQYLDKTGKRWR